MKRIGFIDDYISEWHANNYPLWIREINAELGTDYAVCYAWAERDVSPVDGVDTDAWCEKMGVTRCDSIDELCQKSDVIVILAPSTPERHLTYAKAVLPYRKPTYIDKTFAPDLATARQIFALAKEYGTPFFSTSALRFADELASFSNLQYLTVTGGGSSLEEYIVHTAEIAVCLLREPARRVHVEARGRQRLCRLITEGGKDALIVYDPCIGFTVAGEDTEKKSRYTAIRSDFFRNLMRKILQFFESGIPPFDPNQTLLVMQMRDAILSAEKTPDTWVDCKT